MRLRLLLALVVFTGAVLVAVSPARADGQLLMVTGTGDGAGSCGPFPGFPSFSQCTTLRAAVNAAGSNDVIGLPSGTYQLSSELAITKSLSFTGADARNTIIQGSGSARVLSFAAGTTSGITGITVSGGRAGASNGGNILNDGSLVLFNARVRDGNAASGGGIFNTGTLVVASSLIDANVSTGPGGGIASSLGDVSVGDSTIVANHGSNAGGINASGDGGNVVTLSHVTMAYNVADGGFDPGGINVTGGSWSSYGSLFVLNDGDNNPANCGTAASSGTFSIEDGNTCGFPTPNATNTGLATGLTDQGGHTPVLTIPASGPAKGSVNPCQSGLDQRDAPRNATGACDAGAFEQGAVAPPVTGFQAPTPPTSPPPPPPPPTATPVAGTSVAGTVVKGTVLVKTPGGKFVPLDPTKPIPLGSTIDTKNGTIELTAQQKKAGPIQKSRFFDGIFKITQTKTTTDLTLNEALAKCPKKRSTHAAAKKPKTRKLWGNGSGSFRTRGQYSAATVRGTEWLVQDSCAGTLTRVKKGVVTVRDNVKRKTIVLRAGKKYLARPRR